MMGATSEQEKEVFHIDASALTKASCMRNLFWTIVVGYTNKLKPASMVYGSAFHKFAERLDKTKGDVADARKAAMKVFQPENYTQDKPYLTQAHLSKTCVLYYSDKWLPNEEGTAARGYDILELEGELLVEKKFSIPYYSCDEFEILLTGTMDKIVQISGGGLCAIVDYKTSGTWNIKAYFERFKRSPQFFTYSLVCHKLAEQFPNSIFKYITDRRLSHIIEGVFHSKDKDTIFERSPIFHIKKPDLDKFDSMLHSLIDTIGIWIKEWIKQGKPDDTLFVPPEGQLNGTCKTEWGYCSFFNICSAPDSIASLHLLRREHKKPYNPLMWGTEYD